MLFIAGESAEVERKATIDGAGGVDTIDFKVFERLDEKAGTIVEIVETLLWIVVVVDTAPVGSAGHMDTHRAHIGIAVVGLAIADDGGNAQPRSDGDLIAHIDGKSLVVAGTRTIDMVVVTVLWTCTQEIYIHTIQRCADTPTKTAVVGIDTGLAELDAKSEMVVVVCKVKHLGVGAVATQSKQHGKNNKSCFSHNMLLFIRRIVSIVFVTVSQKTICKNTQKN